VERGLGAVWSWEYGERVGWYVDSGRELEVIALVLLLLLTSKM